MSPLIVVSNVEHFAVFTGDRVPVESLHSHILAKGVVVPRLFEFLLFGGELLNNFLRRNPFWGIGDQRAFLRESGGGKDDNRRNQQKKVTNQLHSFLGVIFSAYSKLR